MGNDILKQIEVEEITRFEQKEMVVSSDKNFEEKAADFITDIILSELRLPREKISSETSFEDLGIDSIVNKQLISLLEKSFDAISKTLFFECRTLGELHAYFLREYREKLETLVSAKPEPVSVSKHPIIPTEYSSTKKIQPNRTSFIKTREMVSWMCPKKQAF